MYYNLTRLINSITRNTRVFHTLRGTSILTAPEGQYLEAYFLSFQYYQLLPLSTNIDPNPSLSPQVHISNAILRKYYRTHNNAGNIRNKPIMHIGRRSMDMLISTSVGRKTRNDTLAHMSSTVGRGDIRQGAYGGRTNKTSIRQMVWCR